MLGGEVGEVRGDRPDGARRADRIPRHDGRPAQGPVGEEPAVREVEALVLTERERVEGVAAVASDDAGGSLVVLGRMAVARRHRAEQRAHAQNRGDEAQHYQQVERHRDRLAGVQPPGAGRERVGGGPKRRAEPARALRHQEVERVERVRGRHRSDRHHPRDQTAPRHTAAPERLAVRVQEKRERGRHEALLVVEPLERVDDGQREQHDRRRPGSAAPPSHDAPTQTEQA